MTTPTPAQVEAVAKAIYEWEESSCAWERLWIKMQDGFRERARAAITAYEQAKEKA